MAEIPMSRDDSVVDQVIAQYLDAEQKGLSPDPQAFLLRYPEHQRSLRSFFENYRRLRGAEPPDDPRMAPTVVPFAAEHDTSKAAPRDQLHTASVEISAAVTVPREFGRYNVERLLGKGGMGAVFLAEDTQLHRKVALKVPTVSMADDPELAVRFQREARAAGVLRHPNICTVFDVGANQGMCYLTMAYIEGAPLSKAIARHQQVAPRKAAAAIRKLALAMQHAHDLGIVHRDLKPANVMVDRRGEPIVMDFGLARFTSALADVRVTQSGMIVGTPAYMSPEHLCGDSAQVGPQADIYSLGVIFYELLTGHIPFSAPTGAQLITQILFEAPRPPSDHVPMLSPELDAICLRMIAKATGERYASMTRVADDIAAYLRKPASTSVGNAVADSPQTPSASTASNDVGLDIPADIFAEPVTGGFSRRPRPVGGQSRRIVVGSQFCVGLAALLGAWTVFVPHPHYGPHHESGTRNKADIVLPPQKPDNHDLPPIDGPSGDDLCLLRTLRGAGGPGLALDFSRDSRFLVAACADGTARVWNLEQGVVIQHFPAGETQGAVFFLPDSDRVVVVCGGDSRQPTIWSVAAGEQIADFTKAPNTLGCAALSAEGGVLAASAGKQGVFVWNLADRELRPLYARPRQTTVVAILPNGKSLACGEIDGTLAIVRLDGNQPDALPTELKGLTSQITGIVPFSDERHLLAVTASGEMWLWDLEQRSKLWEYAPHPAGVSDVRLLSGERHAVTGCLDGILRIWDLESGAIVFQAHHDQPLVNRIAVSSDGHLIAAVGGWRPNAEGGFEPAGDDSVRVWRTPELPLPLGRDQHFAFAPDPALIAQPTVELVCAPHDSAQACGRIWALAVANSRDVLASAEEAGFPGETLQAVLLERGRPCEAPRAARDLFNGNGWECCRADRLPQKVQIEIRTLEGRPLTRSSPIRLDEITGMDTIPISLAKWATHRLSDEFHQEDGAPAVVGNDLRELRPGRQVLGGIVFEIEDAVLDLCSSRPRLPASVTGIAIDHSVATLHFAHLAGNLAADCPPGTVLGQYVVHYADGLTEQIPLRLGENIGDWKATSTASIPGLSRACWCGSNPAESNDAPERRMLRLWLWSWRNPRPGTPIQTLDFVSSQGAGHPTLVGLSSQAAGAEESLVTIECPLDVGSTAPPRIGASLDLLDGPSWKTFNHRGTKNPGQSAWSFLQDLKLLRASSADAQDLMTVDTFENFVLDLEFRWIPGGAWQEDGSGIVLLATGDPTTGGVPGWDPQGIEIDLRAPDVPDGSHTGNGGFVAYDVAVRNPTGSADGDKSRYLKAIKSPGMRPVGEFNQIRVELLNGRLKVWINGELVNQGWNLPVRAGSVALRNQRADVEFQNVKLRVRNVDPDQPPAVETPFLDLVHPLAGHTGAVKSVCLTADGKFGFTAGGWPDGDGTIRKWDLRQGQSLGILDRHTGFVMGVSVTPDGRRLLSGGKDGTVRYWNAVDRAELHAFGPLPYGVAGTALTANGHVGYSGAEDFRIHVWDLQRNVQGKPLTGLSQVVTAVRLSPNEQILAAGSHDNMICLWSTKSGRLLNTLKSSGGMVEDLRFSPNGMTLASIDLSGLVQLWDVKSGKWKANLWAGHGRNTPAPRNAVVASATAGTSLVFVAGEEYIISSGADETFRLWHVASERQVACQRVPAGYVWNMAFAPSAELLLTGGMPGPAESAVSDTGTAQVHLWKLRRPLPSPPLKPPEPNIR
jgi:WD40 repeat protein/serine/threonine protein kinase